MRCQRGRALLHVRLRRSQQAPALERLRKNDRGGERADPHVTPRGRRRGCGPLVPGTEGVGFLGEFSKEPFVLVTCVLTQYAGGRNCVVPSKLWVDGT